MRTGFFAYPWDILDEGAEQAIGAMATHCHCTAIALNCNYHHARLLRPRAQGPKTLQLAAAIAAFAPQKKWYAPNGWRPIPDARLAESHILTQAREACLKHNIDFGLWVVGLHNSTLGEQHPEWCVQNCFGDVYTYALCPSTPQARDYLQGLVNDVCTQFQPHRIILEAVGYLGLRHGVHHELFMTEWSESLELLLSLCFCPACLKNARQANLDAEHLRKRVARLAEQLLNEERTLPLDFAQSEAASLLMEISDLSAYVHTCAHTVTNLVAHTHAAAQAYDVVLEVIPSSFHRPASRAWIEHASLDALGRVSDGLVVLTYFDNVAQVSADLSWVRGLAPSTPIIAGLNACAPATKDESILIAQAEAVMSAKSEALYYYNYGLLTPRRLDWVGKANAAIQK